MLGTLLLAILAGYKRYAHIAALRGDAVAAQVLGMNRVISEDALLRYAKPCAAYLLGGQPAADARFAGVSAAAVAPLWG